MSKPLHILVVEPFYGGSHRSFLEGVVRRSRHRWTLLTGKPVHWKWRSRSAPLELAQAAEAILSQGLPDVVVGSDMLDLPCWRGLLRRDEMAGIPTGIYFHENQWTYPLSPAARADFHFGYTNLLTALAADACWFNSAFHREEFLRASRSFVGRMPDAQAAHDFEHLQSISSVIPPGFDPPADLSPPAEERSRHSIRIGWVSRWEYDKRPDRFLQLLALLERQGVNFRLVLAGPRPRRDPPELLQLRDLYADRIEHDGYCQLRSEYWEMLSSVDVVVSTADHEFFGIAVCESIWAGAAAVLPGRLSYPELVHADSLYQDLEQAAAMIAQLRDPQQRKQQNRSNRQRLMTLRMSETVPLLDDAIERLAG